MWCFGNGVWLFWNGLFRDCLFFITFTFVGGFTLSDLVDKPTVTVVVSSAARYVPWIFIAHRVQHSHCSSIFIECCSLTLSRFLLIIFLKARKNPYEHVHSVRWHPNIGPYILCCLCADNTLLLRKFSHSRHAKKQEVLAKATFSCCSIITHQALDIFCCICA